MSTFFIENCFTCGQTSNDNPNLLRTTRRRKCISIVVNQSHKFGSVPRPLKIKQPQQVSIMEQPKVLQKEATSAKSTYQNCQHQVLYEQTRRLKINPENPASKNKEQVKLTTVIINQSGNHRRAKSNYVNLTFSPPIFQFNETRQKKTSFLKGGAKGIISKLLVSRPSNESFCFQNQPFINSNKKFDCNETNQFSPHLRIPTGEYKQQMLSNNDLCFGNAFANINWTYDSSKSNNYCNLKLKKPLGKGKYCHVNLCQDKLTGTVYTLKEIFKQNTLLPFYYSNISSYIEAISHISHPNIISFYKYSQNKDKIIILQEYSPSTLFEQLQIKKTLPLPLVRQYMKDIVNAIVALHDNSQVHGNLSPHEIGCGFNTCKVRPSLTYMIGCQRECRFVDDIHAIALLGYEMAYGLKYKEENENKNYKKNCKPSRLSSEQMKKLIILDLTQKNHLEPRESHKQLNFFIEKLLSINEDIQLSTNICLSHPFFADSK